MVMDMIKVMLDPGHNYSGADTGAQGNGLREQDVTFLVAEKLAAFLRDMGLEVRMTRNRLQENVGNGTLSGSLTARAEMANEWKADIFVSVHCNSGGGTGVETYCYRKSGEAGKLAQDIQTELVDATGLRDRGVKTKNLAVLRKTVMPAVLAEIGFIDSAVDSALFRDEAGQQEIADGIAQGIANYFDIPRAKQETQIIQEPVYNWTLEVPEWGRPTIQKLLDKGWLKGDENGALGLTETAVRLLVINDRAGLYD